MHVYKVLENRLQCNVKAHRKENSIPNGYALLPNTVNGNKMVYYANSELTNTEPQVLADERDVEIKIQHEIEAVIRTTAIQNLKGKGELPTTYKEIIKS